MKTNLLRKRSFVSFAALASICLSVSSVNAQSFTQPLFIPDTLSTVDHDSILLVAEQTQRTFFPGATSSVIPGRPLFMGDTMPIMTYSYTNPTITNAGILGPTLIWWKGDSVMMKVENTLMDTTTTHWHGAHVAAYNDGGPHQAIPPMTTWRPSFTIRDNATTMWYHPHLHHMTMMQVNMGMAGLIIVKDASDPFVSQLPHTYGVDEFPIILQDKYFGQNMSTMMDTIDTHCSMGTNFLVNGTWQPYLDVPAQMNRFRILNGSSERAYCLFLYDSTASQYVTFNVIASDAGYLDAPYQMGTPPVVAGELDSLLVMMSGERYEIVFDATGLQGHELYLINARNLMNSTAYLNGFINSFAGGPNYNDPSCYAAVYPIGMLPDTAFDSTAIALMKIVVGAANANPGILPAAFTPNVLPGAPDVVRNKGLYLYNSDTAAPPFSIDSVNFEMTVINDVIWLNDTEEWNITNNSQVAHPFHIHDIHFFITEINGSINNVPPYMRGPKDVAAVMDSCVYKLVMTFTDFASPIAADSCYMYHCHILAHEDGGMMHQFVVTDSSFITQVPNVAVSTWSVYPNPTNGNLWLNPGTGAGVLRLYDVTGALIRTWNIANNNSTMQLDINGVAGGMYFLQMERAGEKSVQRVEIVR
jgi:blue copper oxidase